MPSNSPLDNLLLSYPCPIDWDNMTGDETKRFCDQCSMNVYNISSMSKEDAEEFLSHNEDACVKFYLREDGTVKSKSCVRLVDTAKEKIDAIKKAVSLSFLMAASFIFGIGKTAYADGKTDCIKSKWISNKRKYDIHALDNVVGMPARSEVRLLIETLVPRYRFGGSPASEPKIIKDFGDDMEKTRTINPMYISKLKQHYRKTKNDNGYFLVLLLQTLLIDENPTLDKPTKQEAITEFEKVRFLKLNNLLEEAQSLLEKGNTQYAAYRLRDFYKIASNGQAFLKKEYSRPDGLKIWKFPATHPWARETQYKFMIASKSMLESALNILEKLELSDSTSKADELLRRLKYAKLYAEYQKKGSKAVLAQAMELESELNLVRLLFGYPSCYLARYIGYEIEDDGNYSYHFNLVRKFEPIRKIAGKTVEGPKYVFTDSHEYRKSDSKSDPYKLSRYSALLPKQNTEFVLLGSNHSISDGTVPSSKAFIATKELINLAKRNHERLFNTN